MAVVEDPKGEEPNAGVDDVPNPELLNAGAFGAKGLDGADIEKGFGDDCPNAGVEEDPKPELPKLIAGVD